MKVDDSVLEQRRKAQEARGTDAFTPLTRRRKISKALRLFGMMASSADEGAVLRAGDAGGEHRERLQRRHPAHQAAG